MAAGTFNRFWPYIILTGSKSRRLELQPGTGARIEDWVAKERVQKRSPFWQNRHAWWIDALLTPAGAKPQMRPLPCVARTFKDIRMQPLPCTNSLGEHANAATALWAKFFEDIRMQPMPYPGHASVAAALQQRLSRTCECEEIRMQPFPGG